ncbi:hypothetical protein [Hymenobacter sp.]|uniref:hypothetical protein n=1 Tax=Hymenobacter sp. TaxID=1898978 RepID=UPI00286C5F34|nr:hypothetical protein [Hymenobacter sp.]
MSDHHADEIVDLVREVFGKSNEFGKKITYAAEEKSNELIKRFRNDFNPRVAVTGGMISTGTDIKPLECLLFLRDVRNRVYFDQMKGRGTRVISPSDLTQVTSDAGAKTRFVIVDAVGATGSVRKDTESVARTGGLGFEKVLHAVAQGNHDPAQLRSRATRLARPNHQLTPDDRTAMQTQRAGPPTGCLSSSPSRNPPAKCPRPPVAHCANCWGTALQSPRVQLPLHLNHEPDNRRHQPRASQFCEWPRRPTPALLLRGLEHGLQAPHHASCSPTRATPTDPIMPYSKLKPSTSRLSSPFP